MKKIARLLCLAAMSACCVLAWSDAAAVCHRVRDLGHGNLSGFDPDPGCDINTAPICAGLDMVIDNQDDWESLWARHVANDSAPPDTPVVDFSTEVVLATFLGWRRTTGYTTQITCVEYTETIGGLHPNAVVSVLDREAGGTCPVQPALTNWWYFVAAPKTTGLIQTQSQAFDFQHELEVITCSGNDHGGCVVCHAGQTSGEFGLPCCRQ